MVFKLNRTGSILNRSERLNFNENWDKLESVIKDRGLGILSEEWFKQYLDTSGIKHLEEVQSFSDLPSNDSLNSVRGVVADNKIYIKKESGWVAFQSIDISKINDVENKLTTSLETTDKLAGEAFAKTSRPDPKKPTGKGFIVIVDDDARKEVMTKLLPISNQYNIPFTVAAPVDFLGVPVSERLTKEQLLTLQNEHGWEIAGHGYTHIGLHGSDRETVEFELIESKKELESWGLNIYNYVAPFGHMEDALIREVASKYYNTSSRAQGPVNTRPVRNHYLHRVPIGSYATESESSLEYFKGKVDEAKSSDGLLIFMTHAWDERHDETQQGIIKSMIEYAISQGVPFGNLQEGFERYGNMLEVSGETTIGNDGRTFGFSKEAVYKIAVEGSAPGNILMSTTPLQILEHHRGHIIEVDFSFQTNQNFPESKAGTLITHARTSSDMIWQEWHPYQKPDAVYYRSALSNGSGWAEFKLTKPQMDSVYKIARAGNDPGNIMMSTTPLQILEHHGGHIIEVDFSFANDQDFPESKAGTLITHARTSYDMMWQEWHPYQKPHKVYYRHPISAGSNWSAFTM